MDSEPPPMSPSNNDNNDSSGDELFGRVKTGTAAATTAAVTESSGYGTDNVHRSVHRIGYKLSAEPSFCSKIREAHGFDLIVIAQLDNSLLHLDKKCSLALIILKEFCHGSCFNLQN